MSKQILILSGEGIECEREAYRFFQTPQFGFQASYLPLPKILSKGAQVVLSETRAGDWIYFPGGFSFSDHFGSGRLLAHRLRECGFFEEALKRGLHMMGVCNGFQVLVQGGLFGVGVELLENRGAQGQPIGFRNQWIVGQAAEILGPPEKVRLCLRHGEGRLSGLQHALHDPQSATVVPFLHYQDPHFTNGSENSVAGLVAIYKTSKVFGMMPHPEVSMRPIDDPDFTGPEFMEESRPKAFERRGDGVRLMERLLNFAETSSTK